MILAAAALLAAAAAPAHAGGGSRWRDPIAYCRAVGAVDAPDRRYVGPKTTAWMSRPFTAGGPIPVAWRCMDGEVKVCAYGANVPCDGKADTSRRPGEGAVSFCRENRRSDFIPMAATGHDTVYEWSCRDSRAVAGRLVLPVDRRGYQKAFWRTARP